MLHSRLLANRNFGSRRNTLLQRMVEAKEFFMMQFWRDPLKYNMQTWVEKNNKSLFREEIAMFNAKIKALLLECNALDLFEKAIYGNRKLPNGRFDFRNNVGLHAGDPTLLSKIFDQHPKVLAFFEEELANKNSVFVRMNAVCQEFLAYRRQRDITKDLVLLDKMKTMRHSLTASFPPMTVIADNEIEILHAWLTTGEGSRFHSEVIRFSSALKQLLDEQNAFQFYEEALCGNEKRRGLRDQRTFLLSEFFNQFPEILDFFLDEFCQGFSIFEYMDALYQKFLAERDKVRDEIRAMVLQNPLVIDRVAADEKKWQIIKEKNRVLEEDAEVTQEMIRLAQLLGDVENPAVRPTESTATVHLHFQRGAPLRTSTEAYERAVLALKQKGLIPEDDEAEPVTPVTLAMLAPAVIEEELAFGIDNLVATRPGP